MTKHKVKSWAHFFDAISDGRKVHDLRKLDRDYKVGDILVLQRYDNINGEYTGEELEAEITYITSNKVPCAFSSSALDREYGIFSLKLVNPLQGLNLHEFMPFDSSSPMFGDRRPNVIRKAEETIRYASGGPVPNKMYLVGERPDETVYLASDPVPVTDFSTGPTGPAGPAFVTVNDREAEWEKVGEYRG